MKNIGFVRTKYVWERKISKTFKMEVARTEIGQLA